MSKPSALPGAVRQRCGDLKKHWREPAPGNYVPYKEWVADTFAVGGSESMGKALSYISFGVGCYLLTLCYQIPLNYFAMTALIVSPLGYVWSIVNMLITDNLGYLTKKTTCIINRLYIPLFAAGLFLLLFVPASAQESVIPGFWKIIGINICVNVYAGWRGIFWRRLLVEKIGRYKLWIYVNFVPCFILLLLIVWLPFAEMPLAERTWKLYLLFSAYGIFGVLEHIGNVTNVISPNEKERVRILAVPGTVANGINSVVGFLIPAVATYTGGFTALKTYRYIIPAAVLVSSLILFASVGGVHERIVKPPVSAKPKIDFWYGCDAVLRNKFRWIQSVSGIVDALGTGALGLTTVLFIYCLRETDWKYSILNTVLMTAYTPGILLSPLFNRIDYKKMYFITRGLSIAASSAAYLCIFLGVTNVNTFAAVVLSTSWLSTLFSAGMNVINASMTTSVNDYQMWISGERMESFSGIFGFFTGPVITLIGFMIPAIYKNIGFVSNWDVLYLDDVRNRLLLAGCLLTIGGDIASMIPYAFFSFPKRLQRQIIKDLEWRAEAAEDLRPVNETALKGGDSEAVLSEVIARRSGKSEKEHSVSPQDDTILSF